MRVVSLLAIGATIVLAGQGLAHQEPSAGARYGVLLNSRLYPQTTPKEALGSAISAIENRRVDYLLAQLTDPAFVDRRVRELYGGNFDELVRETTTKLSNEPGTVKELRRFLKEGEWEAGEKTATVRLKDIKDRQVFLRKVDDRWYLENRQKPEAPKSDS
jgi:hypothetical protein